MRLAKLPCQVYMLQGIVRFGHIKVRILTLNIGIMQLTTGKQLLKTWLKTNPFLMIVCRISGLINITIGFNMLVILARSEERRVGSEGLARHAEQRRSG